MAVILFKFPTVQIPKMVETFSFSYCYDQPFYNWTIGNPNITMFDTPQFGI